jgi:hypothetical protein
LSSGLKTKKGRETTTSTGPGSGVFVGGIVHFGVGNIPYCGGGKAAAQEELRTPRAFGGVCRASGAVTAT